MITFKQFIAEGIYDNTEVYELPFAGHLEISKFQKGFFDMLDEFGVLLDRQNKKLVGTKEGITTLFKRNALPKMIGSLKFMSLMAKSSDYVAIHKAVFSKPQLTLNAIHKDEEIPYTVVYLGRNKTNPKFYDVLFIHKKNTPFEDLDCLNYPANIDTKTYKDKATDQHILPGAPLFYVIDPQEKIDDDYTLNPNYKYLESHFEELTTDKQRKGGTCVFHLSAPRNENLIIYVNNGYVRLDLINAFPLRVIVSPTGDTVKEKQDNAFAAAVKWVKKNA